MKISKKSVIAVLMMAAMCFGFCACGGGNGSTEETVEITTVAEDRQQDENEDEISKYHEIYNDYSAKMESAVKDYKDEINAKADSMSQDDLYDMIKEKIDKLGKIREEGAGKMTDAMLESTDDDQDVYEKWFNNLNEKYSELQRELSGIYTDKF